MSSITVLLLQTALSLLLLVQNNPNVDNALREQAIAIANQAIKAATAQAVTPVPTPPAPEVVCHKAYQPVCGVNKKTYSNACVATQQKVDIAYPGECTTLVTPTPTPSITVLSPNGGSYKPGDTIHISWTPSTPGIQDIAFVPTDGSNPGYMVYSKKVNDQPLITNGQYDYVVDNFFIPSGAYYITVSNTGFNPSWVATNKIPVSITSKPTLFFGNTAGQNNSVTISPGASQTLRWEATSVTNCAASASPAYADWSGSVQSKGTKTLYNITASGTYYLVCSNSLGTVSSSFTITVIPLPPPPSVPIVSLWIGPSSITVGQKAAVWWAVTGGTAGSRDWIGFYRTGDVNQSYQSFKYTNGVTTGVYEATPLTTGTYEFRYLLNDGTDVSRSNSVTVTKLPVAPAPAPAPAPSPTPTINYTGSISAGPNPCPIPSGLTSCSVTISWQSNAENATIDRVDNNGSSNPVLFATGSSGSQAVQVAASPGYYFRLFSDSAKTRLIAATPLVRGQ